MTTARTNIDQLRRSVECRHGLKDGGGSISTLLALFSLNASSAGLQLRIILEPLYKLDRKGSRERQESAKKRR